MNNIGRNVVLLVFVLITFVAAIFFGYKFYQLIRVAMYEPDGAFAVTPIVNYLLAGIGFLCMLGWATYNGMFRDIERPKITMLEIDARLDAAEQAAQEEANRDLRGTL